MINRRFGAVLVAVASLVLCASPGQADNYPVKDGTGAMQSFCSKLVSSVQHPCHVNEGVNAGAPVPLATDPAGNTYTISPPTSYAETTVTVTANTWTQLVASNASRKKLFIGEKTALGCAWSFNASPATGEGFPFSTATSGGSWVFDDPISTNAVYVNCATGGVITVAAA